MSTLLRNVRVNLLENTLNRIVNTPLSAYLQSLPILCIDEPNTFSSLNCNEDVVILVVETSPIRPVAIQTAFFVEILGVRRVLLIAGCGHIPCALWPSYTKPNLASVLAISPMIG